MLDSCPLRKISPKEIFYCYKTIFSQQEARQRGFGAREKKIGEITPLFEGVGRAGEQPLAKYLVKQSLIRSLIVGCSLNSFLLVGLQQAYQLIACCQPKTGIFAARVGSAVHRNMREPALDFTIETAIPNIDIFLCEIFILSYCSSQNKLSIFLIRNHFRK